MKKFCKMNEAYWLLGNVLCALGIALCTKANLGLSMIAAPPFILNQFLHRFSSFFTQGTCEYLLQAALLIIMCLITRRFRFKYLLSFATAFFFGNLVDVAFWVLGGQAVFNTMLLRVVFYIIGNAVTALAIACYFRTDLPLCVYELFVVAVAERFNKPTHKIKTIFDFSMLGLSVLLSLTLFRGFVGIGIGTVIITLVNSHLIKLWGILLDKFFDNQPLFPKFIKFIK